MTKIGAHVSAAGSLDLAFDRALEIGAECTQIFISPPQQWFKKVYSQENILQYRQKAIHTSIGPNFIHGAYLINLASENSLNVAKSVDWLIYSQRTAEQLGIGGTIFHIGSSGKMERNQALDQVTKAIYKILEKTGDAQLILETSAGAGNTIGDEFFELGKIIKNSKDSRVKVCLDTQHIFASGYDIRTKKGLEKTMEEFDREVGVDLIVAIHTNDSKTELGSHRDRHENIGEGLIGKESFTQILNHPTFKNLPFIIETPGFANTGPDEENIEILKSLVKA